MVQSRAVSLSHVYVCVCAGARSPSHSQQPIWTVLLKEAPQTPDSNLQYEVFRLYLFGMEDPWWVLEGHQKLKAERQMAHLPLAEGVRRLKG